MESRKRFVFTLVIVLSGFLLVPFVALPKEGFRWQLFTGAYNSQPGVGLNHPRGDRGSYFLLSGFGFTPGATLTLKANGVAFGTVIADENGAFKVSLSTAGSGPGRYEVEVDDGAAGALSAVVASTSFDVATGAPVWPAVEGVPILAVPNVPAALTWLPLVAR